MRAFISSLGEVKSVALSDDEIEKPDSGGVETLEVDDIASADQFNAQIRARQLQLAHNQGQLLSVSSSLVRLKPYQLACSGLPSER